MVNYYDLLSVSENAFKILNEKNEYRCNAAGRSFMAENVSVLKPRIPVWSMDLFKDAEELGGLKPGETFAYPNAQGGTSGSR